MSIQDALGAALPDLRRQAESRMTSRCTIMRRTGGTTTNTDGFEVDAWAPVYTDHPVRIGGSERASRTVRVGDSEVEASTPVAHLPASTTDLADGDLIEVTSGEAEGVVYRIVNAGLREQATARRVPVLEVSRPEEWT